MRPARLLPALLLGAALAAPSAASAGVAHTVAPGETLWSLAAAQNMTTRAFAAANGLSEDAQIVVGSTIQLPTVTEAAIALQSAPAAAATAAANASAAPTTTATAGPPPMGGYTVRPRDTLTGLAAHPRGTAAHAAAIH